MEILDAISQYWQVIVGVVMVIIAFANVKSQNAEQERRIVCLERENATLAPTIMEIRTKLASIETTLIWLTKNLK